LGNGKENAASPQQGGGEKSCSHRWHQLHLRKWTNTARISSRFLARELFPPRKQKAGERLSVFRTYGWNSRTAPDQGSTPQCVQRTHEVSSNPCRWLR
jgi:hypothetical protein